MTLDEAIEVLEKDVKCTDEVGDKCIRVGTDCRECEFWVSYDERHDASRALLEYFRNEKKEA